jgi:hypothetical protein
MKKYNLSLIIFGLIIGAAQSSAQVDLQLGARPQGMGGAYVALADDANAVYWNPAGLALTRGGDVQFMHWAFEEIKQITVDYLAIAYPFYKGGIGFSWVRQGAELEEGRYDNKSTMSENSFLLSYGLRVSSRFSLGASLNRRVIYSEEGRGAGIGFEFGGLVSLVPNVWTIGMVAKNVAANMKNESLDPTLYFGTAVQFGSKNDMHQFTLAADFNTQKDIDGVSGTTWKYATGMEYMLLLNTLSFALRGGVGTKNYALGFGMGINTISIDYAYVMMHENTIGNSHKIGFSFQFGKNDAAQPVFRRNQTTPSSTISQPVPAKRETQADTRTSISSFKMTGQLEADKVILKWDSVRGCDGYHMFGRFVGNQWKRLSKKLIKGTRSSVARSTSKKKVELMVRAYANGNTISESNVMTVH